MKVISAEELFYLGKLMNARYIDYDYVRVMKDIQKKGALKESEHMAKMVSRGILFEDFSGQKELDLEIEELLRPVFFGDFESEILYYQNAEEKEVLHHKFHFHEGKITHIELKDKELHMSLGEGKLKELEEILIPESYEAEVKEIAMDDIDKTKVSMVMLLKNMKIGKQAFHSQFIKADNIWYVGKYEGVAESLSKDEMIKRWKQIMKGENE